ncbi:MAG: CotS family spore coat protein [Peptococcaceae bacterium]|nr:CotS family spore coat protein [Peptococcaceae bacterium]
MGKWPLNELAAIYGLKLKYFEPRGHILYMESDSERYALKTSTLQPQELTLEYAVSEHLLRQCFTNIAAIVPTLNNLGYAQIGAYRYLLSKWIDGHHVDFNNAAELALATEGVAKFHIAAKGYTEDVFWPKRKLYGVWPQRFSYRLAHIRWYQRCIQAQGCQDEFDHLFLAYCPKAIIDAVTSIAGLRSQTYYQAAAQERNAGSICHHDLAHHNIILTQEQTVALIDFDYCILDMHLHDLASLILRCVKLSNWTLEPAQRILLSYHTIKHLKCEELKTMFYFLLFPTDFWQICWAKYSEQGLHAPRDLLAKLTRFIGSAELRASFLDQLEALCATKFFLPRGTACENRY